MKYITKELVLIPLIRNLNLLDSTKYQEWMMNVEVTKYTSHRAFPLITDDIENFKEGLNTNDRIVWSIFNRFPTYEYIGNTALDMIDLVNRKAEFAIFIGNKNYWGKGYGTIIGKILLYHAFMVLNLHRIYGGCVEFNTGMQKVFTKLDMINEGSSVDGIYLQGRYCNICHYAILEKEYRMNYKNELFIAKE